MEQPKEKKNQKEFKMDTVCYNKEQKIQFDAIKIKVIELLKQNNYKLFEEENDLNILKGFNNEWHYFQQKGNFIENNQEVLIKISDGSSLSFDLLKNELEIKSKLKYSNSILHVQKSIILEEQKLCLLIYEWSNESLQDYLVTLNIENDDEQTKRGVNIFLDLLNQLVEYNLIEGFVHQLNPSNIFKYSDGTYKFASQILNDQHSELLFNQDSYQERINQQNQIYISPELKLGQDHLTKTTLFSNTYSLGITFFELLGLKAETWIDFLITRQYEKAVSDERKTFLTYIRCFMINKKPKNRYRAIHLQDILLKYDLGLYIDFQEQSQKTLQCIQKFEQQNESQDLFLAVQYNYLSITTQTIDSVEYSKTAILILKNLDLLNSIYHCFFQGNSKIDNFGENLDMDLIKNEKPVHIYYRLLIAEKCEKIGNEKEVEENVKQLVDLIKYKNHPLKVKIHLLMAESDVDLIDPLESLDQIFSPFHFYNIELNKWLFENDSVYVNVQGKINWLKQILHICKELKGLKYNIVAHFNSQLGFYYNYVRQLDKSLKHLNKSIEFYKKYNKTDKNEQVANVLRNVGFNFLYRGDLQKALEYDLEVLKMREDINDSTGILESLQDVCISYSKIKEFKKAIEYRIKRLKIFQNQQILDKKQIAEDIYRIGNLFWKDCQFYQALYYYKHALALETSFKEKNQPRIMFCINYIEQMYQQIFDEEGVEECTLKKLGKNED